MKINIKNINIVFFGSILFLILPYFPLLADEDIATSTVINLNIESATSTIFTGPLTVVACPVSSSSESTVNAYCALKQSGLESDWSSYGDDYFLNSITGINNDYDNNLYWTWFSNLEYGQVSLSKHTLTPNENLLITIGRMPLKLNISTTTPRVGDLLALDVFSFGFDPDWNGVWSNASSSNINIGDNIYSTDEIGHYEMNISTTTVLSVFAQADNFLNSNHFTIYPLAELISAGTTTASTTITATTTIASTTDTVEDSSNSQENIISSSFNNSNQNEFDIVKAVEFLLSKQQADGSIGRDFYTDWVALALSSEVEESEKDKLRFYLELSSDSLETATDYERRAMALMSLNVNPYTDTDINYIEKIVEKFDGNQIGDSSLINDDIFAIFPLINSGFYIDDSIIQKLIEHIISKQKADGSWEGGIDLTSAAIQALSLVPSYEGVDASLDIARDYLHSKQQDNGGFGGSFSTSWAIQAIIALDETDSDWEKKNNTPIGFLASLQQVDGGVDLVDIDESSRIWATAYSIPAVLNKTWSEILFSFPKEDIALSISDDILVSETISTEDLDILSPVEDVIIPEANPIPPDISILFPFFSNDKPKEDIGAIFIQETSSASSSDNQDFDQTKEKENNIPLTASVAVEYTKLSPNIIAGILFVCGLMCLICFLKFK